MVGFKTGDFNSGFWAMIESRYLDQPLIVVVDGDVVYESHTPLYPGDRLVITTTKPAEELKA